MALFYNSSVTVDEEMGLRKTDESFYKFMGQNIYGSVRSYIHPEDLHRFQEAFDLVKEGKTAQNMVAVRKANSDGGFEWLLVEVTLESFSLNGKPLFHLNFSFLTEENSNVAKLRQAKEEYEIFNNLLGSTLFTYHSDSGLFHMFTNCDGQALPLFQDTLSAWRESWADKQSPEYSGEFQELCRKIEGGEPSFKHCIVTNAFSGDGSMEPYLFKCQTVKNDSSGFKVLGCITALGGNQREASLNVSNNLDPGIPILNKKAITEYAKSSFLTNPGRVHLVILDLDDFKTINDTCGHLYGDKVLIKAANIIKENIGNRGIVGRIGGDEMMIVLTHINDSIELRNTLRSIRMGIEWAFKEENDQLHITCSMGAATYPDHGSAYDKIFQLADRMLYIAKNKGKNRYVIYTPEIHDQKASVKDKNVSRQSLEALKNDKTGVMLRLIDEFLRRRIMTYEVLLNEIGYCFELNEIIMVSDNMKTSSTWSREGYSDNKESSEYLNLEPSFLESFDQNNLFVANTLYNLETKAPKLYGLLTEREVKSALFYKMAKNGTMFGYIMFSKQGHGQMWADYEKTLLALVGKAIELSFIAKND